MTEPRATDLASTARLAYKAPMSPSTSTADTIERWNVAERPLRLVDEVRHLATRGGLLYALVSRDLTIRYKRSVLGVLWTMLHPLLLMLIFSIVFSSLLGQRVPRYPIYFLSAYLAWNFFAQTVVNAMLSVAWNGPLMKRVPAPPSVFTLSTTISGLVNLVLGVIVLGGLMLITGVPLRGSLLFLPVSLVLLATFTLGIALVLTAISVFLADVREIVQAALPALMYLTPIVYPIDVVPQHFQWIIRFNPMYYLVDLLRFPIYEGVLPPWRTLGIAAGLSFTACGVGWLVFRHLAPKFHSHL